MDPRPYCLRAWQNPARVDCRITVHPKGRRRVTHIRKLLTGLIRLTAAAAVAATLAACTPSPEPRHLSMSEFATAASSPQVVVVDVRTPQEFAAGHLACAINIDVNAPDFAERISALDKNAHYAVRRRQERALPGPRQRPIYRLLGPPTRPLRRPRIIDSRPGAVESSFALAQTLGPVDAEVAAFGEVLT